MRVPPRAVVELVDPALFVEVLDQTQDLRANHVQLKFVVRRSGSRELVREPVQIKSIELNAEL